VSKKGIIVIEMLRVMKELFSFKNKRIKDGNKSLKMGFLKLFGITISYARITYMELNLRAHLAIRLIHDKLYNKNKAYKSWSDKSYSNAVHKSALAAFVASFVVFAFLQFVTPSIFNLLKPNEALANSLTKTWNLLADFTNNNGATGNVTSSNVNLNSGDPKLTTTAGTTTENTTTAFNTHANSKVSVGTNNVYLLKPIGATATVASECVFNFITGGVCANPWIAGQAEVGYPTALVGKYIYYADVAGTSTWKNALTACVGPQCSTTVAPAPDVSYPSNMVLVNPTTNSGVDFSAYPAQTACKALGGRLPTMNELLAIYAGKVSGRYGSFLSDYYWSSTDYNNDSRFALTVSLLNGVVWAPSKSSVYYVRCVK